MANSISFVHVPKTGGVWMDAIMQKYYPNYFRVAEGAAVQFSDMDQNRSRRWRMPACGLSYSAYEKTPIVNQRWEDSFKLSVCRNPFDMLVSIYHHHNPGARFVNLDHHNPGVPLGNAYINLIHGIKSFDDFIKKFCDPGFPWAQVLDAERYFLFHQLFTNTGECGVDLILRNERLNEAAADILEKTVPGSQHAADEIRLEARINESKKRKKKDYRSYYTDELRELVEFACGAELALFEYDFDGPINDALYMNPQTLFYSPILPLAGKYLSSDAMAILARVIDLKLEANADDPNSYQPLINVLSMIPFDPTTFASSVHRTPGTLVGKTTSRTFPHIAHLLSLALDVPYLEDVEHLKRVRNSQIMDWHNPTFEFINVILDFWESSGQDLSARYCHIDIEKSLEHILEDKQLVMEMLARLKS